MAIFSVGGGSDTNGYIYRWSLVYDDTTNAVTAEASLLKNGLPVRGGFTGVDVTLVNGQTRLFNFQTDPTDILNNGPTVFTNVNVRTASNPKGGNGGLVVQESYRRPD